MLKKARLKYCLRSDFTLLDIGTRVSYHHRAGIARWTTLYPRHTYTHGEEAKWGWKIFEGTLVYDGRKPEILPMGEVGTWFEGWNHNTVREMFFDWPQAKFSQYAHLEKVHFTPYNKTVMIWPSDGFGWIMGIMRKSLGSSSKSFGHGEDYEQGYHVSDMYVDLYVVKPWYEGVQYILCPLWAVKEVQDD